MMLTFDAMRNYFIRMFNYNTFANRQIAELIFKTANKGKPLKLMAHLLAAEQIWLKRCQSLPASGGPLWPELEPGDLSDIIAKNSSEWLTYLDEVNENDFDRIINYKNLTGENFSTVLVDILAHVINHGTHTRAQAGQHLKLSDDYKLPITDYSYYLRQLDKP